MKTIDSLQETHLFKELSFTVPTLVLSAAVAILSACASPAPTGANVNLAGFPPAFRSGYADGCSSATATTKKDTARFRTDTQYAQGWRDGFDICKRR